MKLWYSEKQRAVYGLFLWENKAGERVKCTMVGEEPPNFDDVKCVGEPGQWVATLEKVHGSYRQKTCGGKG